ncbi:RNA binding motif protein 12Ba [Brachyistius frenatus]|uniref:RNA binding motif protein 12Ba n=1 Tax=Brachyistius frenatus TaxID=100188 RepID=UPI0037E7E765
MLPDEVITPEPTLASKPGYVRLFGLPASTTKEDICHFFRGLTVQEAIVNVLLGSKRGCLVKFANMRDACDALCFNQQSLGPICVEVRGATEKLWDNVLQECGNASDLVERWEPLKNPLHESSKHKDKSTSTLRIKRRSINRLPSKPPKKPKLDADSGMPISPYMEHVVMVSNLPKEMTKTEIKELFACPNIARKNVLHLLDKAGCRTDTSFLIFHCTENYNYAMNLNGCYVGSNPINISAITKAMMREMMWKTHPLHCLKTYPRKMPEPKRKPGPVDTFEVPPGVNQDLEAQTCLFARNMPADVRKRHIKDLFSKYKLTKGNIIILHDSNGKGLGEAVVQFQSEKLAALARSIHRNNFLGFNVILTPINVRQMRDIMARNS